jgi:hypothetical protein
MYLSIRHFKNVVNAKESTKLVNEHFYPLISAIPGFVVCFGIETTDGGWASVNIFQTEEGAAESNKIGAAFAKEHFIQQDPPEVVAGTLVCSTAAENVNEVLTSFRNAIASQTVAA